MYTYASIPADLLANTEVFLRMSAMCTLKVDVGWVYNEPEHAIIHKWLLLVDPQEMSMSAKVCVCV